jgi:hypothetical protein
MDELGILKFDSTDSDSAGGASGYSGDYPYPIRFEVINGVTFDNYLYAKEKILYLPAILKAAQKLKQNGCKAVLAECGYLAYFQREVAASVKIPTFLSSLVQAPLAQTAIGQNRKVGIVAFRKEYLADHLMVSCGVNPGPNYATLTLSDEDVSEEKPEIQASSVLDNGSEGQNFKEKIDKFIRENKNLGAIVVEPYELPNLTQLIASDHDIPIFSFETLLDYARAVIGKHIGKAA